MSFIVVLLVFAVLLLVGSVTAIAVGRRNRGPELEPPAAPLRPSAAPPPPAPAPPAPAPAPLVPEPTAPADEAAPPASTPEVVEELAVEQAPEVEAPQVEAPEVEAPDVEVSEPAPEPEPEQVTRPRFRDRLGKARSLLAGYVGSVLSRSTIDDDTWDELEEALIRADVGLGLTGAVLEDLKGRVRTDGIGTPEALLEALKGDLKAKLADVDPSLRLEPGATNVWLFVGVNGVGKTTTIGKVALAQRGEGRSVLLAAGDTFRAAAAEQLGLWGERVGVEVVRGAEGGDPGAVVFDAVQRAAARGVELVLADTAGRLHTKTNLMEELRKVRRVAERDHGTVSEVLLVIDATTGQNGLVQAKQFAEAVDVTGIVLTKLDGTAKGGIALAIQADLGIPIKLVGLGEGAGDLVPFDPDEFVEALFS